MNSTATEMSAELAAELAAPDRRLLVDPRTLPARFHNLKAMAQSAAHCLQSFQSDRDQTLAMRIGSGTHALSFGQPVAIWTGPVRRGKVWDEFEQANEGKVILNGREHAHAQAVSNAIRNHPIAKHLLFTAGTLHEQTIEWEQLGRKRRSTPDARSHRHLVELKTTKCAEPARFAREAVWRGYHAQLADQSAAMEASTGKAPQEVFIVSIETVEPYVVQVHRVLPRALEQGARMCRLWLERLIQCEQSGYWPGYQETIADLDVPEDDPELVFADEAG